MRRFTILYKIFSVLLMTLFSVTSLQAQRTVLTHDIGTQGNLTIAGSSTNDYIITGTTTTNVVTIASGYKGTIRLKNLNIASSKSGSNGVSGVSCITVEGAYNCSNLTPVTKVEVILEGTNTLTYSPNNSGCAFQVNQGAQIHINASDPNDNNSGLLTAKNTGTGSAAIGAPYFSSSTNNTGQGTATQMSCTSGSSSRNTTAGGNIIIGSGTVTALAYQHGAGIGGGWYTFYNGIIIIYGGVVTAQSNYHAAGIGSGCPQGTGVLQCFAENSTIIALPPAVVSAKGTSGSSSNPLAQYGLNGAKNITYMNDPDKPHITIRTEDYEAGANIYIDLTETSGLEDIFTKLGINYDLKKVKIGKTNSSGTDLETELHGRFEQATTFFTDASSSKPATSGRPYMPVKKTVLAAETIVLPLLTTEIAFTDYPSTPLEVGYTVAQARANAHTIKMEYKDPDMMENVTFTLQGGTDFSSLIFLKEDRTTVVPTPTTLNKGDIYFVVLPINQGKPIGIYSDVLMINGKWKGIPLPGYIRRVGQQRVVKNDTGTNNYIKVTASPNKFVDIYPAAQTTDLALNINHTGTNILYDPADVTAKYLVTTEADYDVALAANPLSSWTNLNIPATNAQNQVTAVSFNGKPRGVYYIHWYVASGVVYAHSQAVTNPPLQYGGFGPYIITDAVKAGTLSGNPSACEGQAPSTIKGELSTGGSGDFSYQWQMSTDATMWIAVGGNTPDYTPMPLTVSPTYFRRMTTDNQYGGTTASDNVFVINIIPDGQTLYWKKDATNNNWNDPANWVSASGIALNMVPVSCTNVYIPGKVQNYPSLDETKTPVDIYGSPVCNNITFAHGAELAYQHKLVYQKAFVQYNWGYYDNFSAVNYGDQPTRNDSNSASANKRDVFYTLAAPLKNMATGDFAFTGYPLTWQAGFALADPVTGLKSGAIDVGDFTKTFSTNDVPLSETNNAIAVKVALYQNILGYKDHSNLEGLRGIIEIPYFENNDKSVYYPGHYYDRFTKESKFFYFNPKTLQLLHSPVGRMKRGEDSYRFIYEESGQAPNISVVGVPSTVPGYKQKVKRQDAASLKVMIGNPLMASINMKDFFDVNSGKLLESAGYQLFSSEDQTWKYHSFASEGSVAPLQAFIVTIKEEEVDLLFPLEGTYALTGVASVGSTFLTSEKGNLYLKSANNKGSESDYSILATTGINNTGDDVKKMINSQGHIIPETFFIASDNKSYNLIQAYERGVSEIGIGVKSSDTKNTLSLVFENADEFFIKNNLCPVLFDKFSGVRQNLMAKNTYEFTQRQVSVDNKYIDANRFVLQLLSPDDQLVKGADISIIYKDKQFEIKADQNIKQIQIYDMLGHQIHLESNLNTGYYVKFLPLPQAVYVVKVCTEKGEIKVDKVMAL